MMEKIIAYSVEELYEKVAEQEKRISEIEMRLGLNLRKILQHKFGFKDLNDNIYIVFQYR